MLLPNTFHRLIARSKNLFAKEATHYFRKLSVVFATVLIFVTNVCCFGEALLKEQALTQITFREIGAMHVAPAPLDTAYSRHAFNLYLKHLDPSKRFFTASDIHELEKYQDKVSLEIVNGQVDFFEAAVALFKQRVAWVTGFYPGLIAQPIDFSVDESVVVDPDKTSYADSDTALKERWRKLIKYQVLTTYLELLAEKKGKNDKGVSANVELAPLDPKLEKQAVAKVKKNQERMLARLAAEPRSDYFSRYLDALVQVFDPHTGYFPPEEKEDFDIGMTGRLEGIGAVLREDDGNIKVVRVVPGSPAAKQKELKAEDTILKVGQGNAEPADVVDVPVRDAVKLIRGKKGTIVKLTVKKADGQIRIIPIVRDVVVIEDSYAKAAVIEDKNRSRRFGYIYLPSFYRDFQNNTARNAADDVRRELQILNSRKVNGVILDLRNNGGGSLKDAVKITGHFIKMGPVVQIKDRQDKSASERDLNPEIVYSGPLVVLVNTFSASASEILAAALQDYRRAVIIGSSSSFGKGTVQTFVDLDTNLNSQFNQLKPLGSLKITIQKFYRVTGGSTQYRGVVPDIVLPSTTDYLEAGEKKLPYSLQWTAIEPESFDKWRGRIPMEVLKKKSVARVKANAAFAKVSAYITWLENEKNNPQTLQFAKARAHQSSAKKADEEIQALASREPLTIIPVDSIAPSLNVKNAKSPDDKDWLEQMKKDLILEESVLVLNDFVDSK